MKNLQRQIDTINYINEWRNEAVKSVATREQIEKIDVEVHHRRFESNC